jgi:hypothetical protein
MNNQILKSNSVFVVFGESPAWKTTQEEIGRLFPLVQGSNFNVALDRQKFKEIGSQEYIVDHIFSAPEINLSLDYYLSPFLINESLIGLNCESISDKPAFNYISNNTNNIYVFTENDDSRDGFNEIRRPDPLNINFSGFNALCFGNCYLTSYSLEFNINQIPKVSISMSSSNMKFESITGSGIKIPAINSENGTQNNAANFNLKELYKTITGGRLGDVFDRNEYSLPVVKPYTAKFGLQNLQIGGIALTGQSKPILQSFNLNIDIPRVNLYGLGSNYPYNRKIQYPINGQIEISAIVSGFNSGVLSGLLNNETGYNFDISVSDFAQLNNVTGFYKFRNAKLNNFNYSMEINNSMKFNAQFSLNITEKNGFLMSRRITNGSYFQFYNQAYQSTITKTWRTV